MNRDQKRTEKREQSPASCLCAPRRPFVHRHRFELADGTDNAFRRSTSTPPPLPPWSCMIRVVCHVVWCTWCVIPQRKRKNVHPIHRIGFAGSKKERKKSPPRIRVVQKKKKVNPYPYNFSRLHPIPPPLVWPPSLRTFLLFFFDFRHHHHLFLFILLTHSKRHTHLPSSLSSSPFLHHPVSRAV